MMMNYRRKNKRKFLLIFFFLILILGFSFFNINWPQSSIRFFSNPVIKVKNVLVSPFKNLITSFKDKKDLENKISQLEDELQKLKISSLTENKTELERVSNGVMLKVISRPPFSIYDTLILSKDNQDVQIGDLVFVQGSYVGEISEVDYKTAVVKLRSSSGEKTVVRVAGVDVEAEGHGGGQFQIKIPKDLKLGIGDAVIVPSLNNVVLGVVGSIEEDLIETFKTVYFNIPVSFQDMSSVSVVKRQ